MTDDSKGPWLALAGDATREPCAACYAGGARTGHLLPGCATCEPFAFDAPPPVVVAVRFEPLPDGTTRAYKRDAAGKLSTQVQLCASCCRELHAHAPTCPLMRRTQLASFRVTFDLPPGHVSDLRAEAALEAAEVMLHTELRRLLDASQALTGCRMVVERVDE